jgi:hypothetical protein
MKIGGYRPSNSWLRRQLDTRWRRWVSWCFLGAVIVSVMMAAFIAPRQSTLRMRYEIAQLTYGIERLEGEQRRLTLEREALTSPPTLAAQAGELGLAPVPPGRVAHLTATGQLLLPHPTPTPAAARPATSRRSR